MHAHSSHTMHQPHAHSFDILDLKIRMPPHMTSKFNIMHHHHHTNPQPPQPPAVVVEAIEPPVTEQLSPPPPPSCNDDCKKPLGAGVAVVAVSGLCLTPLFWVVSMHPEDNRAEYLEQRAKQGACFFLLIGPLALPILVNSHISQQQQQQHLKQNGPWLTIVLGCCSLMLGNTAAVFYCAGFPYPLLKLWLISGAVMVAALQKLLLVHKGHVILLMISTASAVVVACLALVAPLLPSLVMTYRCFESTAIPLLWLCWQASVTKQITAKAPKLPPAHSHIV